MKERFLIPIQCIEPLHKQEEKVKDKDGFTIKCVYSDWQIINDAWDHDDVCTRYPTYNYSAARCYANEKCPHYKPIKEVEE